MGTRGQSAGTSDARSRPERRMRANSLRSLAAFVCAGVSLGFAPCVLGEGGAVERGGRGRAGDWGERPVEVGTTETAAIAVSLGRFGQDSPMSEREQGFMGAEASIPTSIAALRHSAALRGYVVRDIRWDPVLQRTWAIFESEAHPERPALAVLTQLTDAELAAERASVEARAGKVIEFQGRPAGTSQIDMPAEKWMSGGSGLRAGPPTDGSLLSTPPVVAGIVATVLQAPVVHSGDRVVLWSEEKNLRLQLNAVVEENGAVGDRVRLHLAARSGNQWGGDPTSRPIRGVVRGPGEVEMEQ